MKKATILSTALFFLFSIAGTQSIFAMEKTDTCVDLRFAGHVRHHPLFRLDLNNKESGAYHVTIKDENDEILYAEKISGVLITRHYEILVDEADLYDADFGLKLEITPVQNNKTEVYTVKAKSSSPGGIVVARL
ncbi:MAG TPA: hypothetical protein PLC48_09535 [Ferruginibacter sp.]|nr:hypothetical protein [Ferruginibacter sp.]